MSLRFTNMQTHVAKLATRAHCCTVSLSCVTVTWQRMFKGSLQVTIINAFFRMCRLVTRLDGARGQKQVCRLTFEPELFRKQMYCIKESACLWHCWDFSVPSAVIRPAGAVIRRPGNCAPFATLLYAPAHMWLLTLDIFGRWCSETVPADNGKTRCFIQCEKKQGWICSNASASTSFKNPL